MPGPGANVLRMRELRVVDCPEFDTLAGPVKAWAVMLLSLDEMGVSTCKEALAGHAKRPSISCGLATAGSGR